WQKKTFSGDYASASDASLETLGNRAWKDKNFTDAIACFDELTKPERVRKRNDPAKTLEFRESLAAVYFESRHWKEAIPLYEVFLDEARRALKDPKAFDSRVLVMMRRLAECYEMGGQPAKAVPLWNDYSRVVFRAEGAPEWFEARYHLANAWANQNKFNEANDVLFRVEAGYGAVGKDPAVLAAVEALKKRIDYETYRKTRIGK
ncbi:MAG: hypothetical protein NTZ61_09300, partial [Proteobacteria bacterium]|nr:hypothetical protein [Pseudomonadota bacterium]